MFERVESTVALLEAGADLNQPDELGFSSFDYLHDKPALWNHESMAPWTKDYSQLDHEDQQHQIQASIVAASSAFLAILDNFAASPEREIELRYTNYLAINRLAFCLGKYGSAQSLEDARVCFAAMLKPPVPGVFTWSFECPLCRPRPRAARE